MREPFHTYTMLRLRRRRRRSFEIKIRKNFSFWWNDLNLAPRVCKNKLILRVYVDIYVEIFRYLEIFNNRYNVANLRRAFTLKARALLDFTKTSIFRQNTKNHGKASEGRLWLQRWRCGTINATAFFLLYIRPSLIGKRKKTESILYSICNSNVCIFSKGRRHAGIEGRRCYHGIRLR